MPAVRKTNPPLTPVPQTSLVGPKHNQPPPFRATGQGYFNKLPTFPANEKIANGVLINNAVAVSSPYYMLYLFVDAVETGWQLSGQTTQAQTSRSFYPMNMSQDDFTIEGTVANQYEYDRIVQFVANHQLSQFNPGATALAMDNDSGYAGVTFKLFRAQAGGTNVMPRVYIEVVITDVNAGHERFMNYPSFSLTCKVINDYLQKNTEDVDRSLLYLTTVKDVYGDVLPPPLTTGNDSGSTQPTNPQPGANP